MTCNCRSCYYENIENLVSGDDWIDATSIQEDEEE